MTTLNPPAKDWVHFKSIEVRAGGVWRTRTLERVIGNVLVVRVPELDRLVRVLASAVDEVRAGLP